MVVPSQLWRSLRGSPIPGKLWRKRRSRESILQHVIVESLEERLLFSVSVSGAATAALGSVYTLTLNANGQTATGWTIDWGDDSNPDGGAPGEQISGSATSAQHIYVTHPGSVTISGDATISGATQSDTHGITVTGTTSQIFSWNSSLLGTVDTTTSPTGIGWDWNLAHTARVDQWWLISEVPGPTQPASGTKNLDVFVPLPDQQVARQWLPDANGSKWVTLHDQPPGYGLYTWKTSVNLGDFFPTTVTLYLDIAAPQSLDEILVNGHSIPFTVTASASAFVTVALPATVNSQDIFVDGENTIEIVTDYESDVEPLALNVKIHGEGIRHLPVTTPPPPTSPVAPRTPDARGRPGSRSVRHSPRLRRSPRAARHACLSGIWGT